MYIDGNYTRDVTDANRASVSSTIIVVVRNRNGAKSWLTVRFPGFMGEPSILMGKQIATNNSLESFTYPYERKLRNYYKPEYRIISTIFQSEYIQ